MFSCIENILIWSCTEWAHLVHMIHHDIQTHSNKQTNKQTNKHTHTHTHTHPFNGPLSMITRLSRYQKGKTSLDFTEARDSEWQWHQLGRMQVCNSLQTDNHASIQPLSFLQAGYPSCHPTNSIKALKANTADNIITCELVRRKCWLMSRSSWVTVDGAAYDLGLNSHHHSILMKPISHINIALHQLPVWLHVSG